ncbi:6-carboxytetrahydropterin synthase [Paracidovorax valerianellae]|uniref:6-carboxy-5,6,7,8-tetrahydropterin synthase n=1 Tax=Paracidovorax valerianellae TaxID=187868 RepID=A0A1G6PHC9_9BURK|nr:6-carboxytetrahydropterin synthase [Paracidovorax valerianellae]MDA8444866.1 6-carboxytetrahydropterin synthase [Paracidovorax valerianellae]SDC78837.1 6-pyruvoyltetrahydropterin/6-carboxytetrahydropterin synthase [Paracidovorax valerianellae]
MQFTVHQRFFFDAAHTLQREIEAEGSRRIHGHTYHAEVAVTGPRDAATGMVIDLGHLRERLAAVREQLDHHWLDEVPGLGTPTLENLCQFIAQALHGMQPPASRVRVWREALGDGCVLDLPAPGPVR